MHVFLMLTIWCTSVAFIGCAAVQPKQVELLNSRAQIAVADARELSIRRVQRVVIDDAREGAKVDEFQYIGNWERIRKHNDGRTNGTSTRSRSASAVAILPFEGRRIFVYGVRGPNGGMALLSLDRSERSIPVKFASSSKTSHALVYESAALPAGMHVLTIGVFGYKYVNLDGVEIEP